MRRSQQRTTARFLTRPCGLHTNRWFGRCFTAQSRRAQTSRTQRACSTAQYPALPLQYLTRRGVSSAASPTTDRSAPATPGRMHFPSLVNQIPTGRRGTQRQVTCAWTAVRRSPQRAARTSSPRWRRAVVVRGRDGRRRGGRQRGHATYVRALLDEAARRAVGRSQEPASRQLRH
eukprot:6193004-Pleurochrysis_carterae.AAC.2